MTIEVNKVLCIARVSTTKQANSGLGIQSQLIEMAKYIERQYGNGVEVCTFIDNGVSGSAPLTKRDGLMSAINKMEKNDVLLAYDLSRVARDTMLMIMIEREVQKKGGRIITVVGNNEDTPEGRLLRGILVNLSEYQRTSQNAKIALALKEKAKTHKLGNAPYGYNHNSDRTAFVENKEEQRCIAIAKAYRGMDDKDWGFYVRLALHLNENGLRSKRGGKWTSSNARTVFHKLFAKGS